MIPKDVLKQVKHIEIKATRLVDELFGGEYESVFKGRGMEFAEVREYVPGDDIRTIDWNVTARSQHVFVKQFIEERELTVMFVVDGSASLAFGTTEKLKATVAAELTGLLAFSAIKNNDKIGLMIYTDHVEKHIHPKKGKSHVLRVVREILYYRPHARKTNLRAALEELYHTLRRRAVIFVISDFIDQGFDKPLRILSQKHDIIAVQIIDPSEQTLPPACWVEIEDAETGESAMVNLADRRFRERYQKACAKRHELLERLFKSSKIDTVKIVAGESYVDPLIKFFNLREKRL